MWIWDVILMTQKQSKLGNYAGVACNDATNFYAIIYRYIGLFFV
jgi:hypothetical protein